MKTIKNINTIAGLGFAAAAVLSLLSPLFYDLHLVNLLGSWNLITLWYTVALLAVAVGLLAQSDIVVTVGAALYGLHCLRTLFWVIPRDVKFFVELKFLRFQTVLSFLADGVAAVAGIGLLVLCILRLTGQKDLMKKLWYVPGLGALIATVLYLLGDIIRLFSWLTLASLVGSFLYIVLDLCIVAGLLGGGLWLSIPASEGLAAWEHFSTAGTATRTPAAAAKPQYASAPQYAPVSEGMRAGVLPAGAFFSLGMHVLLLMVTFGVWNLIWIYRTTEWLNYNSDEPPRDPVTKLLLCMFIPFYSIYWTYQTGRRIDKLMRRQGIPCDEMATLLAVLSVFVSMGAQILIQDRINLLSRPMPILQQN